MAKFNLEARKERTRNTRKVILIVCEGTRTEPNYFQSFKLPKKVAEIVGVGMNTVAVVKHAIELNAEAQYDEVWCVFDRDSFPKKHVSAAFTLASENKIKLAFSNESFELWYLLHFCYLDTCITRDQYCTKLSEHLNFNYKKNNPAIYDLLIDKQPNAIKLAKKLAKFFPLVSGKECDAKPSTSVYKLVERLNKLIEKNGIG